jgi:YD repeat-containing protein
VDLLSTSLTYDGVGRIAREVTRLPGSDLDRSYIYTEDGEFETVTEAGNPTTRYTYNANGNRVSIDVNGTFTTASYDDQDRLTQYGTSTSVRPLRSAWLRRALHCARCVGPARKTVPSLNDGRTASLSSSRIKEVDGAINHRLFVPRAP